MSLTVIVTCDVQARFHGFLGSAMVEVAPGLYVSPQLNRDARDRLWVVVSEWYEQLKHGAVIMLWRDKSSPGFVAVKTLGVPRRELVDVDGLLLTRREL
jgi:CRISPR-associated protein Cas2